MHATQFRNTMALALALAWTCGCSASTTNAAPPKACDAECQDQIITRGLREMVKLAFNLTLQGKPVGAQDITVPCPLGGNVRVAGNASSNADQGATNVDLTYTFERCTYLRKDAKPEENYELTVSGAVKQDGVIAIQPSATTALSLRSTSIKLEGSVYVPSISVDTTACSIRLQQTGNRLAGTLCERKVAVDL
jgi:hypothetical protein